MAAYNIIPSSSSSSFTTIVLTLSPSSLSVSGSDSPTSSPTSSPKFLDSFDTASIYTASTSTSSFGELVDDKSRRFRKLTKNVWYEDASTFEWTDTHTTTTFILDTGVLCESPESVYIERFESVQPAQVAGIEHGPAFRRSSTTSSFRNPIFDEEEITRMCEVSEFAEAAVEVRSPVARASSLSSVSSKKSKIAAWVRRVLRV